MRVTVRYFGIIGDMAKRKQDEIDLPDGATVGELLDHLAAGNPAFAPIARQVRVVLDGQNVTRDATLRDGIDVTLMRAIGGG